MEWIAAMQQAITYMEEHLMEDINFLEAIRLGKIDTAELALPALADSIVLTMKQHGFIEPLNKVFDFSGFYTNLF